MKDKNDLINNKFGKLTVLGKSIKKRGSYLCRCDCGNLTDRNKNSLLRQTKKEKCCKKCNHKPKEFINEIPSTVISNIKYKAKERNIPFSSNITNDFLFSLLKKQNFKCKLSGVKLVLDSNYKKCNISLDRIRSIDKSGKKSAYTVNNVCWVHKKVNIMKAQMSDQEFINWCKIISENNKNI